MADTGLRYALYSYSAASSPVPVVAGEVRLSSDPEVAAHPAAWATVDNAALPAGKKLR